MTPWLTFDRHAELAAPPKARFRLFRRRDKPQRVVMQRKPGRWETAAWFAVALAILAWPRPAYGRRMPKESDRPPMPFWWRLFSSGLGLDPADAEVAVSAVAEPGRGRDADHPAEIPARGWKDILWRTWKEFNNDRAPAVAGGVTFFVLLSLFPALTAFVSLYGLFADVHTAREQLDLMAGVLPDDALNFVGDQMLRLAAGRGDQLSLAFVGSLILSIWSANAAMKALFDGLNIAYEEKEKRGFIRLNAITLACTVGAILFAIVILSVVVALPVALALLGFSGRNPMWMLRWPLLLGVVVLALAALYRFGPSRAHARWRWVSWGSVFAAVLWLAASMAFSWFVSNFGNYDKTYGSLGAVIGFITWIWISVQVVLLGAELNAEMEHQTAVDSTTGPPEPMGKRHARMADTLGKRAGKLAHEKPRPHTPPMSGDKLGPKR